MESYRFVISRRWALFALAVVAIAVACWYLGQWQFHRLSTRKADNAIIRTNQALPPAQVASILSPGVNPGDNLQWRTVTATGTYDDADAITVRYQTDADGDSGVDIVVPLVTADGTVVLVDRGWVASATDASDDAAPPNVPAPPSGEVRITGWVRQDGDGSATKVDDMSTRAISSVTIAQAIDKPTYGGFVDLQAETPQPAVALGAIEQPELDNGPHFFYGLQWWFFGVLAIFGFFYLLWDERKRGPRTSREPAPARAMVAADGRPAPPPMFGYKKSLRAAEAARDEGAMLTALRPVRTPTPAARRKAARRAATEAGLAKARAEKLARKEAQKQSVHH